MLEHRDQHRRHAEHHRTALALDALEHAARLEARQEGCTARDWMAPRAAERAAGGMENGRLCAYTPPAASCRIAPDSRAFVVSPRCARRAPFGAPVAPEVYWICAVSPGATRASATARRAARKPAQSSSATTWRYRRQART